MIQSKEVMSLKALINNYTKSHNIAAQVVLQNFMFERLLMQSLKKLFREVTK